jgi:hypothetical protein
MAGGLIDPNLTYGWSVQDPAGTSNTYGYAGPGYAQAGNAPAVAFGSGAGQVEGQMNSGTAGSAIGYADTFPDASAPILTNPGYADSPAAYSATTGVTTGLMEPQVLSANSTPAAPTIALSTRINNPSGLAASVSVLAGSGSVTGVYVGNYGTGGAGTTNLTQVGSAAGQYTVPPAGIIYVTGTTGATWTWITTN